mmetsp:Transcript_12017/g.38587  ORF Transcript_12017/g.38587 Transcript_12017/m.38587 type:complete len:173 (+) Transcript_12017:33-551(+)
MYMVPLGKERAPAPSTTSSAAEDAAPAQHSRRRAGVIRQAQPEAPGPQLAASHAAAEKRKANKMTPTERKAKRAADQQRRRAAARFNIASEDTEKGKWPPKRSEYDLGEHGQKAYHRHRARWYREHTCKELTGSLEEQNEQWDNYKRNFRARGDSAPLERRHVIEPLWDDSE